MAESWRLPILLLLCGLAPPTAMTCWSAVIELGASTRTARVGSNAAGWYRWWASVLSLVGWLIGVAHCCYLGNHVAAVWWVIGSGVLLAWVTAAGWLRRPAFDVGPIQVAFPEARPFAWRLLGPWGGLAFVGGSLLVAAILPQWFGAEIDFPPSTVAATLPLLSGSLVVMAVVLWHATEAVCFPRPSGQSKTTVILQWLLSTIGLIAISPLLVLRYETIPLVVALFFILAWGFVSGSTRTSQLLVHVTFAQSLRTGRPLAVELEEQAVWTPGMAGKALAKISEHLHAGEPMDMILARQSVIDSRVAMEMQGALVAGQLPEALAQAVRRESQKLLRPETNGHRAILLWTALFVSFFALWFALISMFLIPKFKKIYEGFDVELPDTTMWFIAFSDFVVNHSWIVLMLLNGAVVAVVLLLSVELWGAQFLWDRWLGAFWVRQRTPDLLRGLAWCVQAAFPVTEALNQMSMAGVARRVGQGIHRASRRIEAGQSLSEALQREGFVTPAESAVIKQAEPVGNLPSGLRMLAETIELRRERWCDHAFQWLRPALVLLVTPIMLLYVVGIFDVLVKLIDSLSDEW